MCSNVCFKCKQKLYLVCILQCSGKLCSVIVNMALIYLYAFNISKSKFNLNFDLETLLISFWYGEFILFLYISFKLDYHLTWKIKINITYCINGGSSKKTWIQYKVITKNYYSTLTLYLFSGKNFFYRFRCKSYQK